MNTAYDMKFYDVTNMDMVDELENCEDCINGVDLREVTTNNMAANLKRVSPVGFRYGDEGRCPRTCYLFYLIFFNCFAHIVQEWEISCHFGHSRHFSPMALNLVGL